MLAALALISSVAASPASSPIPNEKWSVAVRDTILTQVDQDLDHYFFVERIPKLKTAIASDRATLIAITDPQKFADATSVVLQAVTHDKHLNLYYSEIPPPPPSQSPDDVARMNALDDFMGRGFVTSGHLHGNIGYLRLDEFSMSGPSTDGIIDDAMRLLAKTDALIIDLRKNGGGDSDTVNYLLGYFFASRTQVSGFLERSNGRLVKEPNFAAATVGGPKYLGRPVYVLISGNSFSGAEQFAYDAQALKRATIVGQASAGAANPGQFYPVNKNFLLSVPTATPQNPITGSNWEGVGVLPDVKSTSRDALLTAYIQALHAARNDSDLAIRARKRALHNPNAALVEALPEH